MFSYLQALILGALQGISELFPISSLGHSVILPAILGWRTQEQDPHFLVFLVATHLATALVLLAFYWKDWKVIVISLGTSIKNRAIETSEAKLGWLLIVSSIPAGLIGFLFQQQIQSIFIAPKSAAFFLALNGILLLGAEWLRKKSTHTNATGGDDKIAQLSWKQGLIVGSMQALALIPGFSRTGAALSGSLLVGLSHEDGLRFTFLLATPIIGAAALLKLPELFSSDTATILTTLFGACIAALCAYVSVRFLTSYFRMEKHTLLPFALYCLVAGTASFAYLIYR